MSGCTCLDEARIGHHSLELNDVDQRLLESDVLDARVVKAVNIVPDYDYRIRSVSEITEWELYS